MDEGREEKQRIKKDAENAVDVEYEIDYPYEKYYTKGYIAGATAENNRLHEQLAKEQELRKELVEALQIARKVLSSKGVLTFMIEDLIQKAKGT